MRRPLVLLPVELTVLAALTLVTVRADCWLSGQEVAAAAEDVNPCGYATEPEPPSDGSTEVTDVELAHDRSDVHVTVHVEDLPSAGEHDTTVFLKTSGGGGEVQVVRSPGQEVSVDFSNLPDYEAYDEVYGDPGSAECEQVSIVTHLQPCDVDGDLDDVHDVVEVHVPRSCLGSPSWVRVGVRASSSGPHDSDGFRSGYWQPAGTEAPTGFAPPYGPRVPLT